MPAEPYGAALIGPMPVALRRLGVHRVARAGTAPGARAPRPGRRPGRRRRAGCRTSCAGSGARRRRRTRRAWRSPSSALRLAPSTYTWPPCSCTISHSSVMRVLVDAVRRRVGDHDRGEVVGVRLALRAQVVEVDRAVVGGLDHDDPHPGHHRGRGVGAVRRRRDQADVAAARRRWRGGSRGSPAARRARPASRRSAGSRPGRSR